MSRIILSRYDDGNTHVVVGWDHPAGGAFWQEWATKQEVSDAEEVLAACEETGAEPDYKTEVLADTGVKREGGMFPGIKLTKLKDSMPEELQPLITDSVMTLLFVHASDPDSGYGRNSVVDLTNG